MYQTIRGVNWTSIQNSIGGRHFLEWQRTRLESSRRHDCLRGWSLLQSLQLAQKLGAEAVSLVIFGLQELAIGALVSAVTMVRKYLIWVFCQISCWLSNLFETLSYIRNFRNVDHDPSKVLIRGIWAMMFCTFERRFSMILRGLAALHIRIWTSFAQARAGGRHGVVIQDRFSGRFFVVL